MDSLSWDMVTTQLAMGYFYICLAVFAVLLRFARKRGARCCAAVSVASALLIVQPLIFQSYTQAYGMMLSSLSFSAALCMLHWAFLEPLHATPSLYQIAMSPTNHALVGVLKVHKRRQQQRTHKTQAAEPSVPPAPMKLRSGDYKPLVVVDAVFVNGDSSDDEEEEDTITKRNKIILTALLQSFLALVQVVLLYDVGLYLICNFSGNMCAGDAVTTGPVASWVPTPLAAILHYRWAKITVFSFTAGNLLPLLMEFIYSSTRVMMLVSSLVWPESGEDVVQWPVKIFNNPTGATSISDLWSTRWHQFLRFYFEGLCNKGVDLLLPKGKAVPRAVRAMARVVAAFTLSGLMHEYQLVAAFGSFSGWNMAFFGLHCMACVVENLAPVAAKSLLRRKKQQQHSSRKSSNGGGSPQHSSKTSTAGDDSPRHSKMASGNITLLCLRRSAVVKRAGKVLRFVLAHLWALSVMALLSPLFIEPYRAAGTFGRRAFYPLGFAITPHVVGWAQQLLAPVA